MRDFRARNLKEYRFVERTIEFPFWGFNICVDFDLKDLKKMDNMKKPNEIIFHNINIDIHKNA